MVTHSIQSTVRPLARDSDKKSGVTRGDFSAALIAAREEYPETTTADTYIVQAGDSLYRISQRFKTSHALPQSLATLVREMTSLNHLADPDRIFPGQLLRLPAAPQAKPTQNLVQALPHSEASTATALILSVLPPPTKTTETPPITTVSKRDFPLFARHGNITLPAKIPPSFFPRQDFPTNENASRETFAIETIAAGNIPGQTADLPSLVTGTAKKHDLETQIAMYKEDQLLAHPGGDYYFLNRNETVIDPAFDQSRFVNRVGKDLADTGANLINIAKNLALGAQYRYMSEAGEIKSGQQVGLLGTLKNFAQDVFSGLSFGAYVPEGEKAPDGVLPSIGHFFKKVLYEAPIRDLLIGIPHAAVNIVKDTALAALNLIEVIPDATIGNFEWGQKATTTVFDNGQVVVDYLTDILPGGNAWLRVHAAGPGGDIEPPVYFNLMTAEQGITDSRWTTVRNTPFRKTVETIGSLLSDAAIIAVTAHSCSPSSDQRHD